MTCVRPRNCPNRSCATSAVSISTSMACAPCCTAISSTANCSSMLPLNLPWFWCNLGGLDLDIDGVRSMLHCHFQHGELFFDAAVKLAVVLVSAARGQDDRSE